MEIRLFDPAIIQAQEPESTVGDIVRAYLAWLKVRVANDSFSNHHFQNLRTWLSRFSAQFRQPASACRQRDLVQFLSSNPGWQAASTQKNVLTAVIGCFRWAADEEGGAMIPACPYRRVKAVFDLPTKPRRPADPAEYVALMRAGSRPLRRALFFMRRTGVRTKEMRELRWVNVHLDCAAPYCAIVKPKSWRRTGKPIRKVGLDRATANWLRSLRRLASDDAHVFLNCDGNPWKPCSFSQHLRRTAERIGLDEGVESRVSAYCLRHSYTVDGIEGGATTREIADQLGHSSTAMIDRVYGSHTRNRETHLAAVNQKILSGRKRILGK